MAARLQIRYCNKHACMALFLNIFVVTSNSSVSIILLLYRSICSCSHCFSGLLPEDQLRRDRSRASEDTPHFLSLCYVYMLLCMHFSSLMMVLSLMKNHCSDFHVDRQRHCSSTAFQSRSFHRKIFQQHFVFFLILILYFHRTPQHGCINAV